MKIHYKQERCARLQHHQRAADLAAVRGERRRKAAECERVALLGRGASLPLRGARATGRACAPALILVQGARRSGCTALPTARPATLAAPDAAICAKRGVLCTATR